MEEKLAAKNNVVECAGFFLDNKGMMIIFKTNGAKETGHAQKVLVSLKKLLRIENIFDTIHVFDEYHHQRLQQWLTHSKLAENFVDSDSEEEEENKVPTVDTLAKRYEGPVRVSQKVEDQMQLVRFETSRTEVLVTQFHTGHAYEYVLQQECTIQVFMVGIWTPILSTSCKNEQRREGWLADRLRDHKNPQLLHVVKETVQLHKEGQFPDPAKDKKTFWVRCANVLKAVNPHAVVERKKLPPAAQAEIHRVLNNDVDTWQLEDKCSKCNSREFCIPEHQQKADAAMRQFAQTAGQLEWPELVPIECSRCKTWRKPLWRGMPEEAQRLETHVGNYQQQFLWRTFKRLRDTVDPEEYERLQDTVESEWKKPRKKYTVGEGVAKEATKEEATEEEVTVATEEGVLSESD